MSAVAGGSYVRSPRTCTSVVLLSREQVEEARALDWPASRNLNPESAVGPTEGESGRLLPPAVLGALKGPTAGFRTSQGIDNPLLRWIWEARVRRHDKAWRLPGPEFTMQLLEETYKGLPYMPGYFQALETGDHATRAMKRVESRLNDTPEVIDFAAKLLGG